MMSDECDEIFIGQLASCFHCGKECESFHNYCSSDCLIESAVKAGGRVIAPNGLPITCVRSDSTMLEHSFADHPTYMFPVKIEFVGQIPKSLQPWDMSFESESHALIYTDGDIALTIYEHEYSLWSLSSGQPLASCYNQIHGWRLSAESIEQIKNKSK